MYVRENIASNCSTCIMTAALNSVFKNAATNNFGSISKGTILDRNLYSGSSADGHRQSHGTHKGSGKHSIALSALTLLAFLFFLNILQNCIQDHVDDMHPSTPQIMVLSSRIKQPREAEKRKDSEPEETKNAVHKNDNEEESYLKVSSRLFQDLN